jgi:hypothetical protein
VLIRTDPSLRFVAIQFDLPEISIGSKSTLNFLYSLLMCQNLSMRWILTIFIGLCVLTSAIPWLQKLGIGRLPGDLNFKIFGHPIQIPLASTILIAVVLMLIGKFI